MSRQEKSPMVKEKSPEGMITQSSKVQTLFEATKSGKGTPIELHCVETVLEQTRNTELIK